MRTTHRRALVAIALAMLVALAAACSASRAHLTASTSSPPPTAHATTTVVTAPTPPPASDVPVPAVTGPITGGVPNAPVNAMPTALATQWSYSEKEYFFSGTARSFTAHGGLGENGAWTVVPTGATAAYRTRMIVRTPNDPARFNGLVVVEWLNETSGRDADPDFGFAGVALMRAGFAYVGVSAQELGIDGKGGFTIPIPDYHPLPLLAQKPNRYRGLQHPGDDFSYDIFSQAAQALWRPNGVNPLGTLHPRRLIATGESQSASRMVTYVNAIAPSARVYDGFVIHSRGGSGAPLSTVAPALAKIVHIRRDQTVPVLELETETDMFGLGFAAAAQPDNAHLRVWEMAGTAHVDQSTLDYGIASGAVWSPGVTAPDFTKLCGRLNDGPEQYITSAGIATLARWADGGPAPSIAPRFVLGFGTLARDALGNARGGIRTPAVDVPTERLDGTFDPHKSVICSLFGSATPLDAATLARLYPTHAAYAQKVLLAAGQSVRAGFLLSNDAATIISAAQAAPIPR